MTTTAGASKFFPKAQEGFTTTTSGLVASGASTVGLNSTGNYSNGDTVVLIIDPGVVGKEQSFTGVIDTSGVQVTGVVWLSGTNVPHVSGATVVDYVAAGHIDLISAGALVSHDASGNPKAGVTYPTPILTTPTIADFTSATHTHATAAGGGTIDWAGLPAGAVVQTVSTNFTAATTGSTVVPEDDTIPQNTEGDQYMTQAITPKSATNHLHITARAFISQSAATNDVIGALFQDSTANALAATDMTFTGAGAMSPVSVEHDMVAGTTSSITFKFRAGPVNAATLTFNGFGGVRKFGGITLSSFTIIEYKA